MRPMPAIGAKDAVRNIWRCDSWMCRALAGFVFDTTLVDDISVRRADFAAALCKVQPSLTRGWHTILDPGESCWHTGPHPVAVHTPVVTRSCFEVCSVTVTGESVY